MQIVYLNEDKRSSSRRVYSVDVVLCVRKISRYLERKCFGRLRSKNARICNSRGIFGKSKEKN